MRARHSFFAFASVFALLPPARAWTFSTYVDIAFPPIGAQDYRENIRGWGEADYPHFDCSRIAIEPNVKRVPFPTTGGFVEMSLVNKSGDLASLKYNVQILIGQITGDNTPEQTKWATVGGQVYKDFDTGSACFPGFGMRAINATNEVSTALAEDEENDTPGEVSIFRPDLDIVGKNATFEARTVLFNDSDAVEMMVQCAYVTFVSPDDFAAANVGGICNNAIDVNGPTATTGIVSLSPNQPTEALTLFTHIGTVTPIVLTSSAATGVSSSSNSSPNLGLPVGISVGVAALFLVVGAVILARRRRRRRKAGKTIALDFFHGFGGQTSQAGAENKNKGNDKKSLGKENETGSIHSERLPTYQEATDVKK